MQNAPATAAWAGRIRAGGLAGAKGHAFSADDRLRWRAIEMLMCDFRLDLAELRESFGEDAGRLTPDLAAVAQRFAGLTELDGDGLTILSEGRPLTRMIASHIDAYAPSGARYSQAITSCLPAAAGRARPLRPKGRDEATSGRDRGVRGPPPRGRR